MSIDVETLLLCHPNALQRLARALGVTLCPDDGSARWHCAAAHRLAFALEIDRARRAA